MKALNMKNSELIAVAIAGVAVWMIYQAKKKAGTNTGAVKPNGTAEVLDSLGQSFSNGWRYFTDGTSISPEGDYYSGGSLVYRAPQVFTA